MQSRRGSSTRNHRKPLGLDSQADGGPPEVVRREPFADRPHVGARGQRTQQRILDAALEVFGEAGYDRCSIDPIANRAGCSRAAFYQYFSGKEDVFRQLTGQVARQLDASTEALELVTADTAGWRALRGWVLRFSAIYDRYEPLFHAVQEASASDEAVAAGSARWGARIVARIRSRILDTPLGSRELDPVILQLLECVTRTHGIARILRSAAAGHHAEDRVGDVLTDIIHRSLFGLREGVNVHGAASQAPPILHFDPVIRDAFTRGEAPPGLTSAGRQTWQALMEAGRQAFVKRGYHRTRVGDVVAGAGVSRAAFYRYFDGKDELARALSTRAMQTLSEVLAEFPASALQGRPAGRRALRSWLRRYNRTQAHEAAILRVWVDAALQDATLRANSAPAFDWGRRAMASLLERRGFGDVDTESVAMVGLLSAFGTRERSPAEVKAAAHIVEQGLFGLGGYRPVRLPRRARSRAQTN
jgi:AcrR family transcriptional regulator